MHYTLYMDASITYCILSAIFTLCTVYLIASEIAFRYSDWKYKWIKRERSLLNALLIDFDDVSKSGDQITQKAKELLDPELIEAGLTVLVLDETEKAWITKARIVVSEAKWCFQCFEKLRMRRESSKWFLSILHDMIPMVDVALGMKWLEDRMNNNLGMNDQTGKKMKIICAGDINGSLEQSRSKYRSLQDRSSVDEIESVNFNPLVFLTADGLISSLENLITTKPDLMRGMEVQMKSLTMPLQLLNAFMKDLQRLKVLESKMESAWVTEANEAIKEAEDVIGTINTTADETRIEELSDGSNWWASRKIKQHIMRTGNIISGLLQTKERYGIKFIIRDPSKSAHRSPQQQTRQYQTTTDDGNLSSPVNKIRKWLNQLPKTSSKLVHHVSSLSQELEDMYKLFQDTKTTEYASNLRDACLEQMNIMASEAEEYHRQNHMEVSRSKLLSEIIRIKNAVKLLHRCLRVFSIEVREESCSIVGLQDDIHDLVSRLTAESKHPSFICIGGMKGIGKTTLAKKVYHHSTIADHFEVRRWVSIPQVSNKNALFASVGMQVLARRSRVSIPQDYCSWINEMREFLRERRYLVVFDHVSSKEALDDLKEAFTEMSNGSRIVVITSNKVVALDVGENSVYHPLRLLTKEESWELFSQVVQYYCPDNKEIVRAKDVVGSIGGLPLAIIRVGYLLWGKKVTLEELSRVLEHIAQGQNQIPWLDNLAVNIVELQRHPILSKCLSYFQLFSRDFEIPARRIVASWVAQGLVHIQPSGDEKRSINPENIAYEYLKELIGRNMIQVVRRKSNGKVRTCRLPTAVRDFLLQGEEDNSSETRSYSSQATSLDGQHTFLFDNDDASFRPNVMQNESYPHSILFFDARREIKPGEGIGEILHRGIAGGLFRQLLVLDLERIFRPQLPKAVGKLKQLTYLGLRWTYLVTIPTFIGNLVNLQTLDLKHTHVRTLPSSIWKLNKLRHLYLNSNCQIPQPNAICTRDLQILSGVFVDKVSLVKDRLDKLINLKKLRLAFQLTLPEQTVLETWIVKLTNLESLKLRSINEKRVPQHLNLEHILDLKKLSSLHLFGKLEKPSIIEELPQSLNHLTLSASGIKEDPMEILGKLPNLRSLCLYSGSYQGKDMVCSTDGFPLLVVLKLWNLDSLEKLVLPEVLMQKLRNLDIRSCSKLRITTGLTA